MKKCPKQGVNDLQTEADRTAQRLIENSIRKQFPEVKVIGEETLDDGHQDNHGVLDKDGFDSEVLTKTCPTHLESVPPESLVVWVDPLDGTSEYTQGLLDHVTVLIGISHEGKAVAGVIHQPYYNYKVESETLGRTIWGMMGVGTFGLKLQQPPSDQMIITTTRSHSSKITNLTVDAMSPTNVLRVGGAGHKVLLVIEGRAHAYVFASSGCKKWDTCGPEAVLRAAGGILTDILGNEIRYHKDVQHVNSTGVLAAFTPETHAKCLSLVPDPAKQYFMQSSGL